MSVHLFLDELERLAGKASRCRNFFPDGSERDKSNMRADVATFSLTGPSETSPTRELILQFVFSRAQRGAGRMSELMVRHSFNIQYNFVLCKCLAIGV